MSIQNVSPSFRFNSQPIRTTLISDQFWFAAIDVCRALDIAWRGNTLDTVPNDWKRTMRKFRMEGFPTRDLVVISEPAVYKLAFRSNKPEADAFTSWVASEVLPTIRKTGKYEVASGHQFSDQPLPLPPTTITPEQQCTLQNMVKALVDRGGIYANIWSRFNNHFRIAKYNQLPQSLMGEAIKYLMAFDTEPRNELPSDPGALLEPHFLKIRILASEINTHEQAIYEIIRQHRGNTFKKLDAKRSAMVNMHGTMDNLFYTINYAVDAAEHHAKAMCMMSNL